MKVPMPIRPDGDTSHIINLMNWILYGKDKDKYDSPVKKLWKESPSNRTQMLDLERAFNKK